VTAEVVPIEIQFNKTNLAFGFEEGNLEPHISQDILLRNTGNATAEFLWGSAGAFECKPEKGNIGPGQTAIVSVIWSPVVGKRNEEEISCHIPGGIDQTLSVSGVVETTKVAFERAKLSVGTIAVGAEHKMEAVIKNTGTTPAVYFIDQLDERAGVKVDPDRGLIMPGEKERVSVTVVPKSTMDYDTVQVPVTIRGNKGIAFKLSGESVIPVIELEQTTMSMPTIAVGSEFRAPMVLTNKSAISASCVLDCKKYPDFKPSLGSYLGHNEVIPSQRDSKGNSITLIEDKSAVTQGQPATQNQWKITLAPGSRLEASMVFAPSVVKAYSFKLDLAILGMENANTFTCQVTAASIASRMGISSHTVEFGDRVVSRDPLSRASYFMEVMFKNLDSTKGFSYVFL